MLKQNLWAVVDKETPLSIHSVHEVREAARKMKRQLNTNEKRRATIVRYVADKEVR